MEMRRSTPTQHHKKRQNKREKILHPCDCGIPQQENNVANIRKRSITQKKIRLHGTCQVSCRQPFASSMAFSGTRNKSESDHAQHGHAEPAQGFEFGHVVLFCDYKDRFSIVRDIVFDACLA